MELRGLIIRGTIVASCLTSVHPAFAQSEAKRAFERHVALGQTIRIRGHVNYQRCGNLIPTEISIVQPPSRGSLSVRDEVVQSTDPELGRGDKCAGYSGEGKGVYYTRETSGRDKLRYDSTSGNGVVHITVTID